eukprot:jgi/Astpho2/3250/fgenesh1_pg.00052_%23_52_t
MALQQDVLGFLDLQDIVCSFMRTLDLPRLRSQSLAQCMTDLEAAGRDFSARQLSDLEELGGDGSFMLTGVLTRLSVWELVHDGFLFPQETKAVHGGKHSRTIVHRVGLFDRQGQMTHILSQSDVVRWLQQHQHALGPLADRTVQQLGLADRWVLKTPLDTSCIQVMELMQQSGLSSAALVDSEGRIVGNFSVSDLRSIVSESFGSMALPVRDFLAEEHRRQSLDVREVTGSDHQTDKLRSLRRVVSGTLQGDAVNQRLVLGSPDEKFRDVLNKMTQHHLHRLYITGSDRKPLSVITLTDILRCICDDANK